jgi:hypothetical protein
MPSIETKQTFIKEEIINTVPLIWKEMIKCYRKHMKEPDKWVDALNPKGGIINNCEALISMLLLQKKFNFVFDDQGGKYNPESATCIVKTLLAILPQTGDISGCFSDGTPYINPAEVSGFKSVPGPYTETIYMTGYVLYYVCTVIGKEEWPKIIKLAEVDESVKGRLLFGKLQQNLSQVTSKLNLLGHPSEDKDDSAPGWGFKQVDNSWEVMLYFTFNALAFTSLLLEGDEKNKKILSQIDEDSLRDVAFQVCRWLRDHFIDRLAIEQLNPSKEINNNRIKTNDKLLYNNAYILTALSLFGYEPWKDEGGKKPEDQNGSTGKAEYYRQLRKAVLFLAKELDANFDQYRLSGVVEDPNQFIFSLVSPNLDPEKAYNEQMTYDDRTIVPLTLMCLCRIGMMTIEATNKPDGEINYYVSKFFGALWEARSTAYEYSHLWDKNLNPSIFYTMRAVDALTEVYRYCEELSKAGGTRLSFEISMPTEGRLEPVAIDASGLAKALAEAFGNITFYAVNISEKEKKDTLDKIAEKVKAELLEGIKNGAIKISEVDSHSKDYQDIDLEKDYLSRPEGVYISTRLSIIEAWLNLISYKYLVNSEGASKAQYKILEDIIKPALNELLKRRKKLDMDAGLEILKGVCDGLDGLNANATSWK